MDTPGHRKTIEQELAGWMEAAFRRAFPELPPGETVAVAPTSQEGFGDYQCNAAMGLARVLKKPPRALAEAAVAAAGACDAVARLEIAGPGFINIHLATDWLAGRAAELEQDARLGVPAAGAGRTLVLDYSSPNVAKPMHIGHIRSTVIGNALDRLHRFLGYRVISDNHLGDWGTQFGLMILGYRNFADAAALAEAPVEELERVYVKSYAQSKEDPAWLEQARAELVKLQQGNPENRALWEQFVQLSMKEFDHIYRRLGVKFDLMRGESFYNDRLPGIVADLQTLGLVRESEGALVADLEAEGLPVCIVRKSDGGYNYATTDLATLRRRVEEFAPEAIVYVTDERQQLHFRQVFTVARKTGWTGATRLEHVWFGLMRLPEGTFSTRQGNVIKLEKLLDEAEARALALLREGNSGLTEAQQREVARCVGIGAVKYADLSQNPQSLVTFSWDKALAMDGNSAPYLQYACARISSVRDKYAAQFPGTDPATFPMVLGEAVERRLALKLVRFGETVIRAAQSYKPSLLADYLFDLAQTYSTFYQNVPFLKAPEGIRESRVRLCGAVARVLRQGLDLLGIETPERI